MTSPNPLRVGLIGAGGRWGPWAHVPALQNLPEAQLYAVCTAHADTAQAAADKYGVKHAYSDVKALGKDPQVEAALVAVRVPAHYALSKSVLEAGKHCYCEWPLGANTKEAEELAALARKLKLKTMVGLQRRASPAYLYMRELIKDGYVGEVLTVNMMLMNSGVLTRTSDRTWQRDAKLGANPFTITFGHSIDALCMVVGEFTEVSALVSTRVPQWFETDTKQYVDTTAPDNIMVHGRVGGGAAVSAYVGVQPYLGSGYRFEIYGKKGSLMMIGGGEAGQEESRKLFGGHKDDKQLKELPAPDRLKWVPESVRKVGRAYDVGQMWVKFAESIRGGAPVEADFDHAVKRHRLLDAIARASETGQRQKVAL
ncbi:MAG: Gfo/Idh/MocA family oxidoreductase [Betaproteobacteria bacterium]|nr:Gfo/Idh/MocA family oxidoreductase [Betaproteobacteria bacterium]